MIYLFLQMLNGSLAELVLKTKNILEEGGKLPFCQSPCQCSWIPSSNPILYVQIPSSPISHKGQLWGNGKRPFKITQVIQEWVVLPPGKHPIAFSKNHQGLAAFWHLGWQLSQSLGRYLSLQCINLPLLFHNWENWGRDLIVHGRPRTGTLGSYNLVEFPCPPGSPHPYPIELSTTPLSSPRLLSIASRLFAAFKALFTWKGVLGLRFREDANLAHFQFSWCF